MKSEGDLFWIVEHRKVFSIHFFFHGIENLVIERIVYSECIFCFSDSIRILELESIVILSFDKCLFLDTDAITESRASS